MKNVLKLSTVDLLLADIKFPLNSPQPFTVAKMLSKMHCIWLKLANIWRWAETILNLKLPITHSFQHFSTCLLIIKSITEVSWWIRHLYMFPCNWYISKFWQAPRKNGKQYKYCKNMDCEMPNSNSNGFVCTLCFPLSPIVSRDVWVSRTCLYLMYDVCFQSTWSNKYTQLFVWLILV